MKNRYSRSGIYRSSVSWWIMLFFIYFSNISFSQGQIKVPFTQRTSSYSPSKKIYSIKGDFTMIGNTNLTLQNYNDNSQNGNNYMVYVDVDNEPNTWNSSSATLNFSTENGAVPSCSNIIYAGLYWTGRASDNSPSDNTFSIKKNGVTKIFNKHKVLFKGPGQSYTQITASDNPSNIYFPSTSDGYMYSAYAEVTDLVRAGGIGEYFVADIALKEGDGGGTGYFGGWGLIVVYENSKMKDRDVTIFDGHAYVVVSGGHGTQFELPVSGFNAAKTGPVNLKLGVMAGEGDKSISGDYFEIQKNSDASWLRLSHALNSTTNFFNSSILTDGNRNPNLLNNTGMDISMFNIPNPGNTVIANSQTSTKFRYGSTMDTYIIFAIAMSVDAYKVKPELLISAQEIGGVTPTVPLKALPGQEIEYKIELRNKGTEGINNAKIVIPIPYTSSYVPGSLSSVVNFTPLPTPNTTTFDPSLGANGSIVWDLGNVPLPGNPSTLLASLTYKLKVTEDCSILVNTHCTPVVATDGEVSGSGAVTGTDFNNINFIQGFNTETCAGEPIPGPITVEIDKEAYVTEHCQSVPSERTFTYCNNGSSIPFSDISGSFPAGSRFYNQYPVSGDAVEYTNENPFRAISGTTTYYAIPPGVTDCFFQFNIEVNTLNSTPGTKDINYCVGETALPLTADKSNDAYLLYFYDSQLSTTPQVSITPLTNIAGETTYWVAEGLSSSCISPNKVPIHVKVNPLSTATISGTVSVCENSPSPLITFTGSNGTAPYTFTYKVNGGASQSVTTSSGSSVTVPVPTGSAGTFIYDLVSVQDAGSASCLESQSGSAVVTVKLLPSAPVSINSDRNNLCPNDGRQITLTASGGFGYNMKWHKADCAGTSIGTGTFLTIDAPTETTIYYVNWSTDCGDSECASITIMVFDTEIPHITAPADVHVTSDAGKCTASGVVLGTPVTSDNCSVASVTKDVVEPFALGNTTVTWTVTDGLGNTETATQVVTVTDTEKPKITAPADVHVTSDAGKCTATGVALGTPVTLDNCSVATVTNDAVEPFALGNITVTWTVTDGSGNTETATQVVTVTDTEKPKITAPAAVNVTSDAGKCTATGVALGTPVTSDNCSVASVTNNAVEPFALGNTTVTWIVTDGSGNTETATQVVTVTDTEKPKITAPADVHVTSDAGKCTATGVALGTPVTLDNCSVASVTNNAVEPFALGNTTVTWIVTDGSGNTETATQVVTVTDTEKPKITAPADISVNSDAGKCTASGVTLGTPVTSDNCSVGSVTNNAVEPFALGNTTVTWTVTDGSGNTETATQVVTVTDTEKPKITAPADVSVNSDAGKCTATGVALGMPVTSDNCSVGSVTNNAVEPFALGNTTVIWTVMDGSGNKETATQVVTVKDAEKPKITAPADVTINADAGKCTASGVALGTPVTSDNCSVATVTNNAVEPFALGNTTVIWTVMDGSGNKETATQVVTVKDAEKPKITAPADVTINADAGKCTASGVALGTPITSDNCSVAAFTSDAVEPFTLGSTTVTWTVMDGSGNKETATQVVTVKDAEKPKITAPADVTINADAGKCSASGVALGTPVTSDNCSVASFTSDAVEPFALGTTTVTWTVTDGSGNKQTATQVVTVTDTQLPAITAPAAVSVNTDAGKCTASGVSLGTPVTSDNCSVASVISDAVEPFALGTTTVTWTVTDGSGNSKKATQLVNVLLNSISIASAGTYGPVCVNASDILLKGTPSGGIWTGTGVSGNQTDGYVFDPSSGTQTLTYTYTLQGGCPNSDVTTITVNSLPVVSAGSYGPLCSDGPHIQLVGTPAGGIWTGTGVSGTQADGYMFDPSVGTQNLTYTYTDSNSCRSSESTTIVVTTRPKLQVNINGLTLTDNHDGIDEVGNLTICNTTEANLHVIEVKDLNHVNPPVNVKVKQTFILNNVTFAPVNDVVPVESYGSEDLKVVLINPTLPGTLEMQGFAFYDSNDNDILDADECAGDLIKYNVTVRPLPSAPTSISTDRNNLCPNDGGQITLTASGGFGYNMKWHKADCAGTSIGTGTSLTIDAPTETTTYYVNWSTDCGDSECSSITIMVFDTEKPKITAPADVSVNSDAGKCTASGVALGTPATSDNCSVATVTNNAVEPFALGNTTVTWTVTDGSGNTETATQVVTVTDTEKPKITAPAAVSINSDAGKCTASGVALGAPVTSDNCSVATVTNDAVEPFALGSTTVIWTVTDGSGNTETATQIVTVTDTQLPTITAPAAVSVNTDIGKCTASGVSLGTPVTSDNCSVASVTNNAVEPFALGNTTVTWTVTDGSGNSKKATQLVNVSLNPISIASAETYGPVCVNAPDILLKGAPSGGIWTGTGVTGNQIDGYVFDPSSGTQTLTYTYTLDGGCANSDATTITVNPQPVVSAGSYGPLCSDGTHIPLVGTPAGGIWTGTGVSGNQADGYVFDPSAGTQTLTYTYTDGNGCQASASTAITVNSRPQLQATINGLTLTDNHNGTDETGSLTICNSTVSNLHINQVSDLNNVTPSNLVKVKQEFTLTNVTFAPVSDVIPIGSYGPEDLNVALINPHLPGTLEMKGYAFFDSNDNDLLDADECAGDWIKYTITVKPLSEDPISISVDRNNLCPNDNGDITLTANGGFGYTMNWFKDNCNGTSIGTGTSLTVESPAVTTIYYANWSTDCGDSECASITIMVFDTEKPKITAPADVSVNSDAGKCTASGVALGTPATSDNCSVATVTNNAVEPFALGSTTVTWTVTDGSGNTETATQVITVTDTEKPKITAPANISVNADAGKCTATGVALGTPVTSDNCSVATVTNNAVEPFALGSTTVTWTVTDGSGNMKTATQIVTVTDTEKPKITAPAAVNVTSDAGKCTASGVALGTPVPSDNCSVASVTNNAVEPFALGNTTVTWIVTDGSGNTETATQVVTVTDTEKPKITAPADVYVTSDAGKCTASGVALGTPVTSDNCSVAIVTNDAVEPFVLGNTTVTWTVTDGSGNKQTAIQILTVTDTEKPSISAPPAITVNTDSGKNTASGLSLGNPVVADNCSVVKIVNDASEPLSIGDHIITWIVTDGSGNISTATQSVKVVDNQNPVFTQCLTGNDQTVSANPGIATYLQNGTSWNPTVADNDQVASLNYTLSGVTVGTGNNLQGVKFNLGLTNVTWTAVDHSGNTGTCTFKVTVVDNEKPVFTECIGGQNLTLETPSQSSVLYLSGDVYDAKAVDNDRVVTLAYQLTGATVGSGSTLNNVQFNPGTTLVTWTAVDAYGNSSSCQYSIIVLNSNVPPTATDDNYTVKEGDELVGDVRANDSHVTVPVENLQVELTSTVSHGVLSLNSSGTFSYKPNMDYIGVDHFTYKICKDNFLCDEANVTITVIKNSDCTISIPNGFSPDGDGINEYFKIRCLYNYPNATLKIYTRSGIMVYEQDHYGNIDYWGNEKDAWWNGKTGNKWNIGGNSLMSATYIYILELEKGDKNSVKTGTVFLSK